MGTAFIFPGQGSQLVGMGRALADSSEAARMVFGEVDEALGQHLSRLMFEGPDEELTLTANAQPAIMALSMAVMAVLERDAGVHVASTAEFVAGHSLGEYSALCAAGSFALADTARLLRRRGDAMQAAVPPGEGAMAALLGLGIADVLAIAAKAAQGQVCAAANDNAPGQVVVSGDVEAVTRAMRMARERGARHSVLLPVSAPFHCAPMAPAQADMAEALEAATLLAPTVPLVANVTADVVTDPETIRAQLVAQVTATVRWRESVAMMAESGVTRMVEVGGRVLGPMVKRIAPDLQNVALVKPDDIDAFLKLI